MATNPGNCLSFFPLISLDPITSKTKTGILRYLVLSSGRIATTTSGVLFVLGRGHVDPGLQLQV